MSGSIQLHSRPTPTGIVCNAFGNASRNSIEGPGTVSNNMALSKTVGMGDTRSMEIRATINNVFNTVQYSGVDTNRNLADSWAGDFGGGDAVVSVYGEVQVLGSTVSRRVDRARC